MCFQVPGWSMRIVEWGVRVRTHFLHMPYGDQAVFVEGKTLKALKGFDDVPLFEDVGLVRRLRTICPPVILPCSVHTSGRRWKELGVWQTMLLNQCIIAGYGLGVNPVILARIYESKGFGKEKKC